MPIRHPTHPNNEKYMENTHQIVNPQLIYILEKHPNIFVYMIILALLIIMKENNIILYYFIKT